MFPRMLGFVFITLSACAPAAPAPQTPPVPAPFSVPATPTANPMPANPDPLLARFADLKPDAAGKVHLTDAQWEKRLTTMQYQVTRHAATERAGTGEYEDTEAAGNYHCICCGQLLYGAGNKFHSGCGWPAFMDEANPGAIEYRTDNSHGMERTEIVCTRCGSHLGHAFYGEGLSKTNVRHCVNSASLLFVPKKN